MDWTALGLNFETIVLFAFGTALLFQLFFYLFFYLRVGMPKAGKPTSTPPLSVVICARNEADNLKKHLPLVMSQDYPEFQVVVVNDGSWDDTADVLEAMQEKHRNLHVVTIADNDNFSFTKKQALTLGVKGAQFEYLVFTDADCAPSDGRWLRGMAGHFDNSKQLVLGYGAYARKKGLLNALIRFDTFQIGLTYLGFGKAGMPYMGVGRNLAYTKSLFFSVGGFKSHYHLASGDDDLFVNQVGRRGNTAVEMSPHAQTVSVPKDSWSGWWRQKQRHFTTAGHYRFIHKVLLMAWPMSTLLWYASFVILMITGSWWIPVLAAFGVRLLLQFIIFNRAMRALGDKDLMLFSPVLELLLLLINPMMYSSNLLAKPKRWR